MFKCVVYLAIIFDFTDKDVMCLTLKLQDRVNYTNPNFTLARDDVNTENGTLMWTSATQKHTYTVDIFYFKLFLEFSSIIDFIVWLLFYPLTQEKNPPVHFSSRRSVWTMIAASQVDGETQLTFWLNM